jgi:hypothetical protein
MAHMHPDLGNLCFALNNCGSFSCLVSLFSIGLDVQIPPLAYHVVPTISRDFFQLKELKILATFCFKVLMAWRYQYHSENITAFSRA